MFSPDWLLLSWCVGTWKKCGKAMPTDVTFQSGSFFNLSVYALRFPKQPWSFPQCPAEGSLYFPVFSWPLPGMEWACLSPKCKCHFSTSLVTTPFLAFIGNDIFLCSLSPTHAAGRQGQLLRFKWLERKCPRPVGQVPGSTENTQIRFPCHLGLVESRERKGLALCPVAINKLSTVISLPWVGVILK